MILDFFQIASSLKKIPRQGWIDKLGLSAPESVADHCYSMALMSMIISDIEEYDSEKILKMVLIHDLAESITGDLTPEQINKERKRRYEDKSFLEIIQKFPEPLRKKYLEIWKEYQENTTKEANLVHQIDKLEMVLQAKIYEKEGHSKEKLKPFFESAKEEITNPKLKELFRKIVEE